MEVKKPQYQLEWVVKAIDYASASKWLGPAQVDEVVTRRARGIAGTSPCGV